MANLITNGTFESGTTGWSSLSINAIAQSNTVAKNGTYSLRCTYQGDALPVLGETHCSTSITFPKVGLYLLHFYIYLTTAWSGAVLNATVPLTGATYLFDQIGVTRDTWVEVTEVLDVTESRLPSAATTFSLQTSFVVAPDNGELFYIDDVYIGLTNPSTQHTLLQPASSSLLLPNKMLQQPESPLLRG